tara:strand:- start:10729 stop:11229 length:501 start_codon:yes stop_codon:yes gene_type:complete
VAKRYKGQKQPFDATTQGLGRNEMVRRTHQHEILATKKYEQSLQYDLKGRKMYDWVSSHQSNPWIVRDQLRSEAKKMWDTAGSFEQGTQPINKKSIVKDYKDLSGKKRPDNVIFWAGRELKKNIGKGIKSSHDKSWYSKSQKKHGFTGKHYLDLSVNKTGKYGVDY